jgi:hypothetical protein
MTAWIKDPSNTHNTIENHTYLLPMRLRQVNVKYGLVLFCLGFGLMACTPTQLKVSQLASKCDTSGGPPEHSEQIVSRVYFDGTPSMAGYVASSNSKYLEALRQLRQVLATAWPNARVNYFRFGERIFPMTSATNPDPRLSGFYQGGTGLNL